MFRCLLLAGAVFALATAAHAETSPILARLAVGTPGPTLNLSRPAPDLPYARHAPPGPTGFAKTAVSHQFADDGPVGSVGYLCGIKRFAPDYYGVGAGPASGFDQGLTFLGVKLDYAFR
jgi:hypothetical protein